MEVGGIVLCGGQSRRMGMSKAWLPFGPERMLQRVARLLGEVVQPLVVVAAREQDLPPLPAAVHFVRDRQQNRGPLEGLRAGLTAIAPHADAAYVTGCDVPLLQRQFVRRLIECLNGHQISVPVDGRFHHPLAAVYRTDVVPKIETLLAEDRLRPRFLFDIVDTWRVPVEDLRTVDPQLQTLANLNRPEDYLAALKLAGFETPVDFPQLPPA
ncbi:MAG: molybdenum cofactor guanylyltransferase [Planctomycetes bacterium]|nr:molybdenum cofactor guanylyltransferase [Planctomycetota bacterium]